jgi:hypothetical protein
MKNLPKFISTTTLFLAVSLAGTGLAFADSAYELTLIRPGLNEAPTVFRTNVASGAVNYMSGGGTNFLTVADPKPVPPGSYHVYGVTSEDKKGSYWLYRIDQQSGRTWYISNNTWYEMTPPK